MARRGTLWSRSESQVIDLTGSPPPPEPKRLHLPSRPSPRPDIAPHVTVGPPDHHFNAYSDGAKRGVKQTTEQVVSPSKPRLLLSRDNVKLSETPRASLQSTFKLPRIGSFSTPLQASPELKSKRPRLSPAAQAGAGQLNASESRSQSNVPPRSSTNSSRAISEQSKFQDSKLQIPDTRRNSSPDESLPVPHQALPQSDTPLEDEKGYEENIDVNAVSRKEANEKSHGSLLGSQALRGHGQSSGSTVLRLKISQQRSTSARNSKMSDDADEMKQLKFSDFTDRNSAEFKTWLERRKRSANRRGKPYDTDEIELLEYLKHDIGLIWSDIAKYFPGRTKATLQCQLTSTRRQSHTHGIEKRKQANSIKQQRSSRQLDSGTGASYTQDEDESSSISVPLESDAESFEDADAVSNVAEGALQSFLNLSHDQEDDNHQEGSSRSASSDSLLGPSHHSRAHYANMKGAKAKPWSSKDADPNSHVAPLAAKQQRAHDLSNQSSLFQTLSRTQRQIDRERERRREIPRRRASSRPLYSRPRKYASEESSEIADGISDSHPFKVQYGRGYLSRSYQRVDAGRSARQDFAFTSTLLPYLSFDERKSVVEGLGRSYWTTSDTPAWSGTSLHVDFIDRELQELENCVVDAIPAKGPFPSGLTPIVRLSKAAAKLRPGDLPVIASHASGRPALQRRSIQSLEAVLEDLCAGNYSNRTVRKTIGPALQTSFEPSIGTILRHRELGSKSKRCPDNGKALQMDLRCRLLDTMGINTAFTGTSGDVHTVAWSPDGNLFAAGSITTTDADSMQYNRPNNLLLGNASKRTLREVREHHINRSKRRPDEGVNASAAMHVTQDPRLFMTVTMVQFSPDGKTLYSAGYDRNVVMTEIHQDETTSCVTSLTHKGPVDLIAISNDGILATGSQRIQKSIKVVKNVEGRDFLSYGSSKAEAKLDSSTFPTSLRWGVHQYHKNYLLAGFASTSVSGKLDAYGETCLWDVEHEKQLSLTKNTPAVFDLAWNPIPSRIGLSFAVGSAAPLQGVNRGTHSIVRFFDPHTADWSKFRCPLEFECRARDMNDIVWCPYDENLISTACTDGKAYLWDVRNAKLLTVLRHGKSLMPLDDSQPAELVDTGVRFSSWGPFRTRYYTGSSDGVIKAWNPYVAPEDMHVRDIVTLNSGIMSGAFNPDYSDLLIGEVNGSVNLLSVGNYDRVLRGVPRFKLGSSPRQQSRSQSRLEEDANRGKMSAQELIDSEAVTLRPMGSFPIRQAVKGSNYQQTNLYDKADGHQQLRHHAHIFQRKLVKKETTTDPCHLHQNHSKYQFTEEERLDSKRSKDRIPHALRLASKKPFIPSASLATTIAPTACSKCGRPARPKLPSDSNNQTMCCELCEFNCLHCSALTQVRPGTDTIDCHSCGAVWRGDILGFTLVKDEPREKRVLNIYTNIDTRVSPDSQLADTEGGDFDGLADFYHNLWQDRPEPPL
ncbi:MAG: hypothetical protein M1820_002205 [Bogoriella megaspora]|nr:MAG: hypothetical protein M1820_002205 [Bogoriella megaspora]